MVYLCIVLYFNIIFMKDESTSFTYVCSSESVFIGGTRGVPSFVTKNPFLTKELTAWLGRSIKGWQMKDDTRSHITEAE